MAQNTESCENVPFLNTILNVNVSPLLQTKTVKIRPKISNVKSKQFTVYEIKQAAKYTVLKYDAGLSCIYRSLFVYSGLLGGLHCRGRVRTSRQNAVVLFLAASCSDRKWLSHRISCSRDVVWLTACSILDTYSSNVSNSASYCDRTIGLGLESLLGLELAYFCICSRIYRYPK